MREIKFRAWDNVDNEMLYCGENVDVLFILGSVGIECTDIRNVSPDGHDVFKEHLQYMQYTGLKDKNGKEIYEGDIINNSVVYWSQQWAMFTLKGHEVGALIRFVDDYEIQGNIYENPELLEV